MTTQRVLITGASGFIGRPMVAALLRAGYTVRAVTRRPVSFPNRATAAKEAGVGRFIYISSVRAQSGASSVHPVREQDEPRPTNQYGRSKLAGEMAVKASGVPFTIFRPVVVYGPGPKGNMRTLARLARLPLPLPVASFTGRRSLLGIDNLISAILFALKNPATVNETYLLADGTPMTVTEVFATLRKIQGRSLTTIYAPRFIVRLLLALCGRGDLWSRFAGNLIVDTTKFASLGWLPVRDTSEGLLAMVQADDGKGVSMMQQVL